MRAKTNQRLQSMTGSEIKKFYKDWPPGVDWYHETGTYMEDPSSLSLEDTKEYDIDLVIGNIWWHGQGDPPAHIEIGSESIPVRSFYEFQYVQPSDLVLAWRLGK